MQKSNLKWKANNIKNFISFDGLAKTTHKIENVIYLIST